MQALYVTRMMIMDRVPGTPGDVEVPADVIVHHASMMALQSYLRFHALRIGKPAPRTPFVEVKHADGSDLTAEEFALAKAAHPGLNEVDRLVLHHILKKAPEDNGGPLKGGGGGEQDARCNSRLPLPGK